MGILSDRQLARELVEAGRVRNFDPHPDNAGRVSAGLSSFGIDCRVGHVFKLFDPLSGGVVDPKNFDPKILRTVDVTPSTDHVVLPPYSFALAESIEWFDIPRDTLAVAFNKSTLLRCGLYVSTSVMEPGWKGTITLEISNLSPLPVKVYAGEGICQLVFFRSDERTGAFTGTSSGGVARHAADSAGGCGRSYAERGQKGYQNQSGVTPPAVRKGDE